LTDHSDIYAPAPEGTIYVCAACGKTSLTQAPTSESTMGWDESCMLNCVLVKEDSIKRGADGRVTHADAVKP
jgi:hypothetical protein